MATLIALATKRPDPMRLAGPLKPVLTGLLQRDPQARMSAAEAELRLHQVPGVQTAVRLWHVPPNRRAGRSATAGDPSQSANAPAAHRVSLEAAIARLEWAGQKEATAATPVDAAHLQPRPDGPDSGQTSRGVTSHTSMSPPTGPSPNMINTRRGRRPGRHRAS